MGNFRNNLHRFLDGAYNIGFVENFDIEMLRGSKKMPIQWLDLNGYTEGWFADPFILDVTADKILVLAEEWSYSQMKGRISLCTIKRADYKLLSVVPLLELESHLSFPYIFNADSGDTLICPENVNGAILYRLTGNALVDPLKIIDGHLLDTQIAKIDDHYYAFAVKKGLPNQDYSKKLFIYRSDDIFGPYQCIDTIDNGRREQRGAGPIFKLDDRLIRPAQNCEGGYGKGLIFYEIALKYGSFLQQEIGRVDCEESSPNGLALHTFSPCNSIAAVDGFDYISRPIGRLAPKLYNFKALLLKVIGRYL